MRQRPIWLEDSRVMMVDQTLLPNEFVVVDVDTPDRMWTAIKRLEVRGAPAIGIAAMCSIWLGVRGLSPTTPADELRTTVYQLASHMATCRPTAVNLFWGLNRAKNFFEEVEKHGTHWQAAFLAECQAVIDEDNAACREIGRLGAELLSQQNTVLTHCNAGSLATGGWGTATAPVYYAREVLGRHIKVFADETRPLLQGARLTAWELARAGVDVTLICDNMAATVMARGWIDAVIVGTDRVAANGDFANKIGTYGLSILAKEHGIPVYVAAPTSSIDLTCPDGPSIPIEERHADEVRGYRDTMFAPEHVQVFNPAFDVTPAKYVTAIITESGVVYPPFGPGLADAVKRAGTNN